MQTILSGVPRVSVPSAAAPWILEAYRAAIVRHTRLRVAAIAAARGTAAIDPDFYASSIAAAAELDALSCAAGLPFEELYATLGLAPGARDALRVLAACRIDRMLGEHLLAPNGSMAVDRIRELVATDATAAAFAAWFAPRGVIEACGLVDTHVSASGIVSIAATTRLLGLLDGQLVGDARLAQLVHWRPADANAAVGVVSDEELARLARQLDAVTRTCTPPLVLLTGTNGTGKTRLAQGLAAAVSRPWMVVLDLALLPRDPVELAFAVRLVERDARFLNGLIVMRGLDQLDPARRGVLASVLARIEAPTLLGSAAMEEPQLESMLALRYAVRRPGCELRERAWVAELGARSHATDPALTHELATNFPITRSAIGRAVDLAESQGPLDAASLSAAAQLQIHSQLERYAKRMFPRQRFDELVLNEELQAQILEIYDAVRMRPELTKALGPNTRLSGPKGIAALFNGAPGTGKTMTAGALANELGLPLYRIDVSSIVDRYVGETEKNLARVFEEAEIDRGLLLFDEADSLFSKRVEVSDAQDRYANMQVNVLLNLIEDYSGLVILTTNLKASMDTAFLRRVAFKITFDVPDVDERRGLWEMHLPPEVPRAPDLDLELLAREFRTSGGEIRNAVYRAVLMAGPHRALTDAMLRRSVSLEIEGTGGVVRRSM